MPPAPPATGGNALWQLAESVQVQPVSVQLLPLLGALALPVNCRLVPPTPMTCGDDAG